MEDYKNDKLICVDLFDKEIGYASKEICHKDGKLHRAFSVFLYNGDKVLLQRRAEHKYHSGGLWANSCCSHPRYGETLEEAVGRRLQEELGVCCRCSEVGSFVYRHKFSDELFEYEYDHVFVGEYNGMINANTDEIMETRWVEISEIEKLVLNSPEMLSVWFFNAASIALSYIKIQASS